MLRRGSWSKAEAAEEKRADAPVSASDTSRGEAEAGGWDKHSLGLRLLIMGPEPLKARVHHGL